MENRVIASCDPTHDQTIQDTDDAADAHKAHRLIGTAADLLYDALDRIHPGTDPDVVHMPRHLVETLTRLLHNARNNVPLLQG